MGINETLVKKSPNQSLVVTPLADARVAPQL
jgi:hypothetical protein